MPQNYRELTNGNPVTGLCVGLLEGFVDRDTGTKDRGSVIQFHSIRDLAEMVYEGYGVLLERAIDLRRGYRQRRREFAVSCNLR